MTTAGPETFKTVFARVQTRCLPNASNRRIAAITREFLRTPANAKAWEMIDSHPPREHTIRSWTRPDYPDRRPRDLYQLLLVLRAIEATYPEAVEVFNRTQKEGRTIDDFLRDHPEELRRLLLYDFDEAPEFRQQRPPGQQTNQPSANRSDPLLRSEPPPMPVTAAASPDLHDLLRRWWSAISDHANVMPSFLSASDATATRLTQQVRLREGAPRSGRAHIPYSDAQSGDDELELQLPVGRLYHNPSIGGPPDGDFAGLVARAIVADWDAVRDRYRRFVVLGDPGFGKSWLLAREARQVAAAALADAEPANTQTGWPLWGRLDDVANNLEKGDDFWPAVAKAALSSVPNDFDADMRARLVDEVNKHVRSGGRVRLLLDSLDEVPQVFAQLLRDALDANTRDNPNVEVVVTSRLVGYRPVFNAHDAEIAAEVELQGFTNDQVTAFVDAWFVQHSEVGERLRSHLKRRPQLRSLARIPLACAFLCVVASEGGAIPDRRIDLYRSVVDQILARPWRPLREQPSAAIIDARRELLKHLGWKLATGEDYWRDRLPQTLARTAILEGHTLGVPWTVGPSAIGDNDHLRAEDELKELHGALIPVGTSVGSDRLFVHRTIHEYLVAAHVAGRCSEIDVVGELSDKWWFQPDWYEVIAMTASLLPVDQAETLISAIAEDGPDTAFGGTLLRAHILAELPPETDDKGTIHRLLQLGVAGISAMSALTTRPEVLQALAAVVASPSSPEDQRRAAMDAIAGAHETDAVESVAAVAIDASSSDLVRSSAISTLGSLGGRRAQQALSLVEKSAEAPQWIRQAAGEAARAVAHGRAKEAAKAAAEKSNDASGTEGATLRADPVRSLPGQSSQLDEDRLLATVRDSTLDYLARCAAVQQLRQPASSAAIRELQRVAECAQGVSHLRLAAALRLAVDDPIRRDTLADLAKDDDAALAVRQEAVDALAAIDHIDAAQALFDLVRDPASDVYLREDAANALVWAESQGLQGALLEILEQIEDPHLLLAVARAIGPSNPTARQTLERLAGRPHTDDVRLAAAHALGPHSDRAADTVIDLSRNSHDRWQRRDAIRMLGSTKLPRYATNLQWLVSQPRIDDELFGEALHSLAKSWAVESWTIFEQVAHDSNRSFLIRATAAEYLASSEVEEAREALAELVTHDPRFGFVLAGAIPFWLQGEPTTRIEEVRTATAAAQLAHERHLGLSG